jgi:outer membrane protein assembly factor BamE (lipoprotein component of BamABCDE complex)
MWPTWADIIGYDLGIEYYNYAIAGLGNVGIQHRIVEADVKHNISDGDIVLIMWTSWCREDRVKTHEWNAAGSVLHLGNPTYDRKFVQKYWDYSNDIVKNSTSIITANKIYKNNIKWQGTGLPLFFTEGARPNNNNKDVSLIKIYKKHMPKVEFVNTFKNDFDDKAFGAVNDCHPDVKEHIDIVKNHVYKKMNLTLGLKTEKRFLEFQSAVENHYKNKTVELSTAQNHIHQLLSNSFQDIQKVMNYRTLL